LISISKLEDWNDFIFKRNTPQLAAAGIKGMRIQFRLRSAWPGSNFMRQRLGCPAACGVGALPPFHYIFRSNYEQLINIKMLK